MHGVGRDSWGAWGAGKRERVGRKRDRVIERERVRVIARAREKANRERKRSIDSRRDKYMFNYLQKDFQNPGRKGQVDAHTKMNT